MQHLVLHLCARHGGDTSSPVAHHTACWGLYENGERQAVSLTPQPLAAIAASLPSIPRRVTVLAPGCDAPVVTIPAPDLPKRRQRQALPFLMETYAAEAPEKLHVSASEARQGLLPVALLRQSLMADWCAALAQAGLAPHVMFPDMLALPASCLLVGRETVWARLPTGVAFRLEASLLPALRDHLPPIDASMAIHLEDEADFPGLEASHPVAAHRIACAQSWLLDRAGGQETPPLTLLHGPFPPARLARGGRAWIKPALLLILGWAMAQTGLQAGAAWWFARQTGIERAASAGLYRRLFPQETVIDPYRQLQAHLAAAQIPEAPFLHLLARVAALWEKEDGLPLPLQALEYRAETQELSLTLAPKRMETLNRLAERLERAGLPARLSAIAAQKDGLRARLTVTGGKP
jgi:type II secretion system protein L